MEISDKQIKNIEIKKSRFEEIKQEFITEKTTLDKDISQLRNALSTNTTTQSVDTKTGQITTKANNGNRKAFESQLNSAIGNKNILSSKIEALNDSITNLEVQILDMESKAELGNELGAVQYVSEITGAPMNKVANIFILLIVFVFDPLAITLIIATNQAFKRSKPEEEPLVIEQPTPIQPNEEEQRILNEIHEVENSNVSGRKKWVALENLHQRLKFKRDEDNTKTY
jgi:hypothetical protein